MSRPVDRLMHFYATLLAEHGPTAIGMGWGSAQAQRARLRQLLRLLDPSNEASVIDYGCGYGAFLDFLREHGSTLDYCGYDISPAAVALAKSRHPGDSSVRFTAHTEALEAADYCVASGIFSMRLGIGDGEWLAYIHETIAEMWKLARRGIAFNALTSYSDAGKQRPDLYYADPCSLFDHCKRTLSPHVALLHDYGFWDFTLIVRREAQ